MVSRGRAGLGAAFVLERTRGPEARRPATHLGLVRTIVVLPGLELPAAPSIFRLRLRRHGRGVHAGFHQEQTRAAAAVSARPLDEGWLNLGLCWKPLDAEA